MRAAGNALYCYDANGSLIQRRTTTGSAVTDRHLAYDMEGRLVTISGDMQVSFTYDGDGNRVKKVEGGITTVYVGAHYEYSKAPSPVAVPDESFEEGVGWGSTEGQASTTAVY
ncbi:MAG: hypothetical protein H0T73_19740, partial [Ardenticatenales bacterium]|nr:hypothetical protein [Ardenticatenales bacterium]